MTPDKKFCSKYNPLFSRRERGPANRGDVVTHPCQRDGPEGYDSPVPASERPGHQAQAGAWQANKCTAAHAPTLTHTKIRYTLLLSRRQINFQRKKNPKKHACNSAEGSLKSSDSLLLTSSKVSTNAQLGGNEKTNL